MMTKKIISFLNFLKDYVPSVAILFAGIWAFAVYVWPEFIRPSDFQVHLNVVPVFELDELYVDHAIVYLKIDISNDSKRFLYNLASSYTVRGFSTPSVESIPKTYINLVEVAKNFNETETQSKIKRLFYKDKLVGVVATGKIFVDNSWFSPQEKFSTNIAMVIPCDVDKLKANLYLHNLHSERESFTVEWDDKKDVLWPRVKVRNGKYPFAMRRTNWKGMEFVNYYDDIHARMKNRSGITLAYATAELYIPWKPNNKQCARNFQ